MNKTLYKLKRIGERLWILARLSAAEAAALANDGKGLAVVAEETGKLADKVSKAAEEAILEGADINKDQIVEFAFMLDLLALNCAIEAFRLGHLGKQAAVCANDIRNLANEIVCLFNTETADKAKQCAHPWPKYPQTSVGKSEFLHLVVNGINILENMANVQEVCACMSRKGDAINLRGMELPLVNCYKILGETREPSTYVIIKTPWAEQNKTYAAAAEVKGIHLTPIGKHADAPDNMPLAKYVRECWENENGELFYFIDWTMFA